MDELVAFVRRCVDEDERVELAAYGRNWDVDHEWVVAEDMHLAEVETASAQHIARWDPARAQAEVEAKRRILDLCAPEVDEGTSGARVARLTIHLLAQPYAGQDGWREEWAL